MNRRVWCGFVLTILSALTVRAQQQATAYASTSCVKVQPGKAAEFAKFQNDVEKKIVQLQADEGEIASRFLSQTLFPGGEEARCNYIVFTSYSGIPPVPAPEHLTSLLKKAGVGLTSDAYFAKTAEVERTISVEMFRQIVLIGNVQKGDYIYLNFMKVHDLPGYLDFERTIYKPVAEGFMEDGTFHAWIVLQSFLPGGTGLPYQAISADIFPSWEKAIKGDNAAEMYKKVHPNLDQQEIHDRLVKLRDLDHRYLVVVQDVTVPSTKAAKP